VNIFGLPIGAKPGDPVVGEVDGQPVYMTPDGRRYYEPAYEPQAPAVLGEALTTSLDSQGRAVHDRTPYRPPGEGGRAIVEALMGEAWRGVAAPGRALMGEPVTYGDAWATALDWGVGSAPTRAPKGALRAGGMADDAKGIRAYHGSPHDFDRFQMDKIGTGEGAQAYGHGLYFAEAEDVAQGYRDALQAVDTSPLKPLGLTEAQTKEAVWRIADTAPSEIGNAARDFAHWFGMDDTPELRAAFGAAKKPGHMYEVNIKANPDDFLDWDAPMSEQPEVARRLGLRVRSEKEINDEAYALFDEYGDLSKMPPEARARLEELNVELNLPGADQTGQQLYEHGIGVQENVHDFLTVGQGRGAYRTQDMSDAGIPGIKYKDAMSRGVEGGTRNYVVFDENLIEIVRKYGIAGAAAALGMTNEEIQQRLNNAGLHSRP
jgi:hypothetical protein